MFCEDFLWKQWSFRFVFHVSTSTGRSCSVFRRYPLKIMEFFFFFFSYFNIMTVVQVRLLKMLYLLHQSYGTGLLCFLKISRKNNGVCFSFSYVSLMALIRLRFLKISRENNGVFSPPSPCQCYDSGVAPFLKISPESNRVFFFFFIPCSCINLMEASCSVLWIQNFKKDTIS